MNDDMECPYCGEEQEVCHDDGHGYAEDKRHEHDCSKCGKIFVFTTYISYHYTPYKADCLNGEPHRLKKTTIFPPYWPDAVHCQDCDYEKRGKYKEVKP